MIFYHNKCFEAHKGKDGKCHGLHSEGHLNCECIGCKHLDPIVRDRRNLKMDEKAKVIVMKYIIEHLDKSDNEPVFEVYIVWKSKILQNWKYLISSNLYDGMYYELTFNGDKGEWYLDAYKKFENRVITTQ